MKQFFVVNKLLVAPLCLLHFCSEVPRTQIYDLIMYYVWCEQRKTVGYWDKINLYRLEKTEY